MHKKLEFGPDRLQVFYLFSYRPFFFCQGVPDVVERDLLYIHANFGAGRRGCFFKKFRSDLGGIEIRVRAGGSVALWGAAVIVILYGPWR